MPFNNNIRTVYVGIHLGGAPSFELRADSNATATPIECRFNGQGIGVPDRDFLLEILRKIEIAYGTAPAITLCLNGTEIRRDSEC
jgi:hypothetical protein